MASRRLGQLWTTTTRAAGWGYANKGDTRFAAERRLWRAQMKELRRNLQNEELVARREAYLAACEKKAAFDAEQARHQPSPMAELRKLEMQARLDLEREEADAARLERRTAAMEKESFKREAENKERLTWLEELQRDYSVDGTPPQTFSLDSRKKRAFLTPEVQARQGPAPPPRPATPPPRPAPPRHPAVPPARTHARPHARTPARMHPHKRTYTCTHARTHARTVEVGGHEARAAVAHRDGSHRLVGGVLECRHAPEPRGGRQRGGAGGGGGGGGGGAAPQRRCPAAAAGGRRAAVGGGARGVRVAPVAAVACGRAGAARLA